MRLTLRILSALLRYPDEAVQQAAPELAGALAEDGLLSSEQRASLQPLLDALASTDLLDAQERYVGPFDRGRAVSLHLFEHVHGESRDRGQAMVAVSYTHLDVYKRQCAYCIRSVKICSLICSIANITSGYVTPQMIKESVACTKENAPTTIKDFQLVCPASSSSRLRIKLSPKLLRSDLFT